MPFGQDRMDLVGNGGDQRDQEGGGRQPVGALHQLDESELARAVDSHEEIEFAFGGLHFGDVDVKEADRIGLELLLRRLVAFDVRQAADPVSLKAAMQA
jgi:hypothetical protein